MNNLIKIFVIITLIICIFNNVYSIKKDETQKQNIIALQDSIKIYKDKNGIGFKKAILRLSKSDLKKYNINLYNDLINESGEVKIITKYKLEYRDTGKIYIINKLEKLTDTNYSLNFNYKDSIKQINGKSYFSLKDSIILPDKTIIDNFSLKLNLITGIKTENGIDKIFIKTKNENVYITNIEGVDISNYYKKKKFSINTSVGYGFIFSDKLYKGPCVFVGIGYNILNF